MQFQRNFTLSQRSSDSFWIVEKLSRDFAIVHTFYFDAENRAAAAFGDVIFDGKIVVVVDEISGKSRIEFEDEFFVEL